MHEARVRVIYGDTDQMGVVYYANYLRYFEAARAEFLRAHGGDYRSMERDGYFLPVVEAACTYKAPARYDDLLRIVTTVTDIKRVSLTFAYSVIRESDGLLLSVGKTVHACVNKEGRPQRLPELVQAWREPLGSAPKV